MATKSNLSSSYPTIVQFPSSLKPPPEGWENAQKGFCTMCKAPVWMLESYAKAIQVAANVIGLCSACADKERERQARG